MIKKFSNMFIIVIHNYNYIYNTEKWKRWFCLVR